MIGQLVLGIYDGLRGAGYLASHPRLWGWVLAPLIVAVVVLVAAYGALFSLLSVAIASLAAALPGAWAGNVIKIVAGILLAVGGISIFLALAVLIAAPFNEELSQAIEEHETGTPGPKFSVIRFVIDLVIGITHSARRLAVYLVIILGLLILGVAIPAIGTVAAAALGAIVTARFASYDAFDAIWARRRYRYRAKVAYLRENRWRTLGLGAVVAALLLVPGLNIVGLAIGAVAATLRVLEQERAQPPRQAA